MNLKIDSGAIGTKPKFSTPLSSIPSSSPDLSPIKNNNYNIKRRPLKHDSQNLSFKGLSFNKTQIDKAIEKYGEELGTSAKENFKQQIKQAIKLEGSGLTGKIDKNGNITSIEYKEQTFTDSLKETLVYPFKEFPSDVANSTVKLLKMIPGLKTAEALNFKFLRRKNELTESISNAFSIKNYLELANDDKSGFVNSHSRFSPKVGNYSTNAERALTRFFTGAVPAFFLANDAYNLSIYMNNNKDLAKKEKNRRFAQEATRIILTSIATFGALKLFSKSSNSSSSKSTLIISIVTFASEIIGRAIVGNPVLPISESQAREYAIKQGKIKDTPTEKQQSSSSTTIENNPKTENKTQSQKSILTLGNVAKALGGLVLLGYGSKKIKEIEKVQNFFKDISTKYEDLYKIDYKISVGKLNEIIETLEDKNNGFENVAKNYKNMILKNELEPFITKHLIEAKKELTNKDVDKNAKEFIIPDESINKIIDDKIKIELKNNNSSEDQILAFRNALKQAINNDIKSNDLILNLKPHERGPINNMSEDVKITIDKTTSKTKEILIHQILTFPVRYSWKIATLPYRILVGTGKFISSQINLLNHYFAGTKPKPKEEKAVKETEVLQNGINYILKNKDSKDFKDKFNKALLNGFDGVTKSSFSNADLANAVKNSTGAITSGFLIADNYNMVMIDTQGQDKELAGQKAKERTIQRTVRLAYGAFLVKFYSSIFQKQFNGSMLGAQSVNTLYAVTTETLERTSVGLPLTESTRNEIQEKEQKHLNATGIKGSYFRLMAKLTGKKALSEKIKKD